MSIFNDQTRRCLVLIVLVVTTFACREEGGVTGFFARLDDIECRYDVECGFIPSRSDCKNQENSEENARATQASIDAGRLVFNEDLVDSCIAEVEAFFVCNLSERGPLPRCEGVLEPVVPEGGTCFDDVECAGEAFCMIPSGEFCAPGTCVSDPRPAPVDQGEDCSDAPCAEGLFCRFDTDVCDEPAGFQQPCYGFNSCEFGLVCTGFIDEGTCERLTPRGESCTSDRFVGCELLTDYCDAELGICTPYLGVGESCAGFDAECVDYALCENDVCTSRYRLGDECVADVECIGDMVCSDETDTCVRPEPEVCIPATQALGTRSERN